MKTIITTILTLLSVLSAPALKAQCTCGNNTYSSYSNSNTQAKRTPSYYKRTSNGQLMAVYADNNAFLQSNNTSCRTGSTHSNLSYEVDMTEQSSYNSYSVYNEYAQPQSNYNTAPQRRTFIQKVNRGVQVINALGQIANAVQTIVNPNVSFY